MALLSTLADIRRQAKQRADMENSDFIADSEWLDMINASYAELYDILVQKGIDMFVLSQSFAVNGTTSQYALPTSVYKLTGIDYQLGGLSYPMQKFVFADRWKYRTNQQVLRYRLVGNTIYFVPTPAAQTLTLWYVPPITRLAVDADTVDTVNEWAEYIIIDAAIKARIKEESDTAELFAQKQSLVQRIQVISGDRDHAFGERVTDVSGMNYPDSYWLHDR